MDFSICVYFPLFLVFQRWDTHPDVAHGAGPKTAQILFELKADVLIIRIGFTMNDACEAI